VFCSYWSFMLVLQILLNLSPFLLYHTTNVAKDFLVKAHYFVIFYLVSFQISFCCVAHREWRQRGTMWVPRRSGFKFPSPSAAITSLVSNEVRRDRWGKIGRVPWDALTTSDWGIFLVDRWRSLAIRTSWVLWALGNVVRRVSKCHGLSLRSVVLSLVVWAFTTSYIGYLVSTKASRFRSWSGFRARMRGPAWLW
jgi:hypothetical protein